MGIVVLANFALDVANARTAGTSSPSVSKESSSNKKPIYLTQDTGSQQKPFVVRTISTPETQSEASNDAIYQQASTADRHTVEVGIAAISFGLFQTIALFLTFWIMRRTATKQLRAYCLVESARIENIVAGQTPVAVVTIRNSGQTPAAEFRQWANMGFDHFPQTIPPPMDEREDELPSHPLAPGREISAHPSLGRALSAMEVAGLQAGAVALYVIGRATYIDSFGKEQFTEYCLFAGGPIGIDKGQMSAYPGQNHFT